MGMISCNMALFWLDIVVEVVEEPLPIVEKYRKTFPQNVPIALKYLALKAETIGNSTYNYSHVTPLVNLQI